MSLYRYTQMPPPPEPGEKSFWDYFPKRTLRRVFFMLLALGVIIYLKMSGTGSFGGLFEPVGKRQPAQVDEPVYHIEVKPPPHAPETKSKP